MRLQEIQELTGGSLSKADVSFNAVSIDSRTLAAGNLYVAIKGEHFDGNDFVAEAEKKGAAGAIINRETETALPTLQVKDTRLALGKIGLHNRLLSQAKVLALTGSQGKTTVKEMTASILAVSGKVLKTKGNLNNDLGVPLTLLQLEAEHEFAVIELGANAPGEIAYSSAFVRPQVAHITNVAPTHLEGFGDLDGVARAKGEIWESLDETGIAVVNLDDAYAGQWIEQLKGKRLVTISALGKSTADFRVAALEFNDAMYSQFILHTPVGELSIKLALPGHHNVSNALAAAALSIQAGAGLSAVQQGLQNMQPAPGRMTLRKGFKQAVIIDDSYNASPSSFQAAIDVLARQLGTTIIAMGDMAELGSYTDEAHREIGTYARQKGIDLLYTIGSSSQLATESFGKDARHFTQMDALAQHLMSLLDPTVTLLIKGSRSAGMDKLVSTLTQEGD